jgi:hypothetical protein
MLIPEDLALNYLAHNGYNVEKTIRRLKEAPNIYEEWSLKHLASMSQEYVAHLCFLDA